MATWPELVRLMGQAHVLTARGVWRGVGQEDQDDDEAEPDDATADATAQPRVEVQRFVYQSPNRWRVTSADGSRPLRMCDGQRMLLWRDASEPPAEYTVRGGAWGFSPDPLSMLRPIDADDWSREDDYSKPLASPVRATMLRRECWRVDLAPPAHKTGTYSLWIDAATGVRLRAENSVVGLLEEFVELELDGSVEPSDFSYEGPVDRSEQDGRDRDEAARRHYQAHPPPVPTVWPRGIGFHVWEGDAATGSYVAALEVPGSAMLARHPAGASEWTPPWTGAQVHRWEDQRWQWTLVVEGEPLTPAELAAVVASIPTH